MEPAEVVATVAREAYGRLLAFVAARAHDLSAAEDALAEAFRAALETWTPATMPSKPEAWLLTAARRRLTDEARRRAVRAAAAGELQRAAEAAGQIAAADEPFPDERLKLLFVCAHPAIDPAARTPLMLQAVLGLTADQIASAFLVASAAMSQRLVRAKTKIRDARIPFAVPDEHEFEERTGFVLDAIYAAFSAGWEDATGADAVRRELAAEAVWLGRVACRLLPAQPEAWGLLALMLHCKARHPARRDAAGCYVPLDRQDTAHWRPELLAQAEECLARAAVFGRTGRFQIEAAIQSVHNRRPLTGRTDWPLIIRLYDTLLAVAPGTGARVGRVAALAAAGDPAAALAALEEIEPAGVRAYQPYWAARAHVLRRLGRDDEAAAAVQRAAGLTEDPAVRDFLLRQAAGFG